MTEPHEQHLDSCTRSPGARKARRELAAEVRRRLDTLEVAWARKRRAAEAAEDTDAFRDAILSLQALASAQRIFAGTLRATSGARKRRK